MAQYLPGIQKDPSSLQLLKSKAKLLVQRAYEVVELTPQHDESPLYQWESGIISLILGIAQIAEDESDDAL